MKNRRIISILLIMTILFSSLPTYAETKTSSQTTTVRKEDTLKTQAELANEAVKILKKTNNTSDLTLKQTEALYNLIYPEVLSYVSAEDLYKWTANTANMPLDMLSLAVHEESHYYSYASEQAESVRSIDNNRVVTTFSSSNLNRGLYFRYNIDGRDYSFEMINPFMSSMVTYLIPKECQSFFISNYVMNKSSASDTLGIYGMINEYNSHTKALEVYTNYSKIVRPSFNMQLTFLNFYYPVLKEIEACILAYLIYAEEFYPAEYKYLIENKNLRIVFSRNDDKTNDCYKELFKRIAPKATRHKIPLEKLLKEKKFAEMKEKFYLPKTEMQSTTGAGIEAKALKIEQNN